MSTEPPNPPIEAVRWIGRAVVVDLIGDIDLNLSQTFQQAMIDVIDQSPQRVVINLAKVGYMDSSGIASLVKLLTLYSNVPGPSPTNSSESDPPEDVYSSR